MTRSQAGEADGTSFCLVSGMAVPGLMNAIDSSR
jgi:hypothetical protein